MVSLVEYAKSEVEKNGVKELIPIMGALNNLNAILSGQLSDGENIKKRQDAVTRAVARVYVAMEETKQFYQIDERDLQQAIYREIE